MPLLSVALTAASEPPAAGGITLPPALPAAALTVNVSFGAVASLSETCKPGHRGRPVAILGDADRIGVDDRSGSDVERCVRRIRRANKVIVSG